MSPITLMKVTRRMGKAGALTPCLSVGPQASQSTPLSWDSVRKMRKGTPTSSVCPEGEMGLCTGQPHHKGLTNVCSFPPHCCSDIQGWGVWGWGSVVPASDLDHLSPEHSISTPENLLEIKILRHTEKLQGRGPAICVLMHPLGDPNAPSSVRTTALTSCG